MDAARADKLPAAKARQGILSMLFPFLLWWPRVNRRTLRDDALAGITGALIVLPQGVAFATIAGLPPQYGLYAAMVPAIVAALWGSSWHLVSGPTTAISIAVFAALSPLAEPGTPQYISLVLTLTFFVGVFQLVLGLARMGALVNFISHSVVIGFTAGAAVLIAASQVRNFFGIDIPRGTPFYEIIHQLGLHLFDANPYVLAVSGITLATGIATRRYWKRMPYMIAAMVVGSLVAAAMNGALGQDVTGIRTIGALPGTLPPLSMPDFSLDTVRLTLGPALVITMLALTEAVSIARAIGVRSEQRIDGSQEFIGQGLSNIVGAFFSSYAASGSFNRSGVNYESGAKTPLASIVASVFLVVVLLLVAPLVAWLPTAAMAGILFLVAWGLIDFHHIRAVWQTSKPESAILAATLLGTLFNLELGILVGVLLSLVVFLYRTSRPQIVPVVPADQEGAYHFVRADGRPECCQLRIVRVNGALYFGAAAYVQRALQQIDEDNPLQKSVLIAAAGLTYLDIAGAEVLAQEARRRRRLGGGLYFYRLDPSIYQVLRRGNYVKDIGEGAFFPVMSNVIGAIYRTLDPDICSRCTVRAFKECRGSLLPDGFRRQRLMLATDGGESAGSAAEVAAALAQCFGVKLDITADRAAEGIAAAAAAADTNILVVGHRTDAAQRRLRSTPAQLIAEAGCHVLLVDAHAGMWSRRIVLASEGADDPDALIEMATQIAKVTRTPITLVAVAAHEKERTALAADLTRKAGIMRLDGVVSDTQVLAGNATEAIVTAARELGADLVILGAHRGTGLNRLVGGSVVDHVVRELACAVLVVKPAHGGTISAGASG